MQSTQKKLKDTEDKLKSVEEEIKQYKRDKIIPDWYTDTTPSYISSLLGKETDLTNLQSTLTNEVTSIRNASSQQVNEGAVTILTELFERRFRFDGKSTTASKRTVFKPRLCRDYLQITEKDYRITHEINCQVMNISLPKFLVTGGHLFKHEWKSDAEILLGMKSIDSTRNGALLFLPIEKAYGRSQVCFLQGNDGMFYLKLLDPSLEKVSLYSIVEKHVNEVECAKMGKTVGNVLDSLKSVLSIKDSTSHMRMMNYKDLEGKPLLSGGKTRPYKRCLNFQAARARKFAIEKEWLQPSVQFKYSWSTEFPCVALESYLEGVAGESFEKIDDKGWEDSDDEDDGITPQDAIDEDEEE